MENFPNEYICILRRGCFLDQFAANYKTYEEQFRTQEWFEKLFSVLGELNYTLATCAKAELFPAAGCSLLAGKYPVEEDEIAIHKKIFDFLCWSGFQEGNMAFMPKTYSDLLGKKMQDGAGKEVTIVGVFDREGPAPNAKDYYEETLSAPAFLFRGACAKEDTCCMYAHLKNSEITFAFSEKCKDVTEKIQENFAFRCTRRGVVPPKREFMRVGAESLAENYNLVQGANIWLLSLIFAGAGGVFFIFSVILSVRMIADVMEKKRREIGILISLGASKGKLTLYFAMGFLALALIIFTLALGMSTAAYFAVLRPSLMEGFYVCCMQYSLWTVLILFSVTFLCTLSPVLFCLIRYFQKSAIENFKTYRGNL